MDNMQDQMNNVTSKIKNSGVPIALVVVSILFMISWCVWLIWRYFKKNYYILVVIQTKKLSLITKKNKLTKSNHIETTQEQTDFPLYSVLRQNVNYVCSNIFTKSQFVTKSNTKVNMPFQNSGSFNFFINVMNDSKYNWESTMNETYSHVLSVQRYEDDLLVDRINRECKFTDMNINQSLLSVFIGNIYNELIITMRCSTDGTSKVNCNNSHWQKIIKLSNIITIQTELQNEHYENEISEPSFTNNDMYDKKGTTALWNNNKIKCGFQKELDVMTSGERLPFGKWTHIGINVKEKNVDLYVNGKIYNNYVFNDDTCMYTTNSLHCINQAFSNNSNNQNEDDNVKTNTGYPILFRNKMKFRYNTTSPESSGVTLYCGIKPNNSNFHPINAYVSRICYTPTALTPGHLRMLSYKNPDESSIFERLRDKLYNWSKNIAHDDNSKKLKHWYQDKDWHTSIDYSPPSIFRSNTNSETQDAGGSTTSSQNKNVSPDIEKFQNRNCLDISSDANIIKNSNSWKEEDKVSEEEENTKNNNTNEIKSDIGETIVSPNDNNNNMAPVISKCLKKCASDCHCNLYSVNHDTLECKIYKDFKMKPNTDKSLTFYTINRYDSNCKKKKNV